MRGKRLTAAMKFLLLAGLVVGGSTFASCTKEKEVEVTREVPVQVTVEVPVTKEVPMNLARTAAAIRDGNIDVGAEYGLSPTRRYHTIHNTILGLSCLVCHQQGTIDTEQVTFTAQDVSAMAPGPVDKRPCLGCHTAAGPARELYGDSSP